LRTATRTRQQLVVQPLGLDRRVQLTHPQAINRTLFFERIFRTGARALSRGSAGVQGNGRFSGPPEIKGHSKVEPGRVRHKPQGTVSLGPAMRFGPAHRPGWGPRASTSSDPSSRPIAHVVVKLAQSVEVIANSCGCERSNRYTIADYGAC
jgi:hypothetical protein